VINSSVMLFVCNCIIKPSPSTPMFFATYIHSTRTFHHLLTLSSYPLAIAVILLKLVEALLKYVYVLYIKECS
jgi:hypothetical protein